MKLDKETTEILSNFAKINPGLVFKKGNVVMTVPDKNSTPIVKVEFASVQFPRDFALYNIQRFLSLASLFVDPTLSFTETDVLISDQGGRSAKLRYASPSIIVHPDYDDEAVFDKDLVFELTEANLKYITKAAAVFAAPEIAIIGNGQKITVSTFDSTNSGVDKFSVEVGETDRKFTIIINAATFGFLNRSYTVSMSFRGLIEFRSENEHNTITYWITASEKSKISN